MADKDVVRQTGESVPYKEIYFLGVASQSNIYCCSKLQDPRHGYEKLLVGTLRGKVSCLECRADTHTVEHQPQANEVYFTYIPGKYHVSKNL